MDQRTRLISCTCIILFTFCLLILGCGGGGDGTTGSRENDSSAVISGRAIVPDGSDSTFNASDSTFDVRMRSFTYNPEYSDSIPLVDATINISGTSISALTDSDGCFTLTDLPTNKELTLSVTKGNIRLLKQLKALQPGEEKILLINYQTTAASLVYDYLLVKQGGSPDIELLEKMTNCYSSPVYYLATKFRALLKEDILSHLTEDITKHANVTEVLLQINDALPPELISLSFSPSRILAGSTVKISAVFNEENWIDYAYLCLKNYSDQKQSMEVNRFDIIKVKGELIDKITIEADLKIPDYLRPDEFYVNEFIVEDVYGNRITYSSNPGYQTWDYKEHYEDLPTLTIINTDFDDTPPTFIDIYIETTILSSPDDEITLNIVSDDDRSGVDEVSIMFELAGEDYHYSSIYAQGVSLNESTGYYEAEFTLTADNFYYPGEYILDEIELIDKGKNALVLRRDDFELDPDFWDSLPVLTIEESSIIHENVEENEDALDFLSVKFSPNPANAGDKVTAVIELTGINETKYIGLKLQNQSQDSMYSYETIGFNFYLDRGEIDFDAESELWICRKAINLPSYVESGSWEVYYLISRNTDAPIPLRYTDSRNNENDSFMDSIPPLTINPNPKEDITSPEILSILFEPGKVRQGDDLLLTLEIKDDLSGPVEAKVEVMKDVIDYSYSYELGPTEHFFLICYDVKKDDSTEGIWRIDAKTTVPQNSEAGVWKPKYILIEDLAGNQRYYYLEDFPGFLIREESKFIIMD